MLKIIGTIEDSDFPLCFRFLESSHLSSLVLGQAGNDIKTHSR